MTNRLQSIGILCLLMVLPSSVWAETMTIEQRLQRLERVIEGQGLTAMLSRIDQLQREVQRLDGENETLNHRLQQLQNQQRQMYLEIDDRLNQAQPTEPTELPVLDPNNLIIPDLGDRQVAPPSDATDADVDRSVTTDIADRDAPEAAETTQAPETLPVDAAMENTGDAGVDAPESTPSAAQAEATMVDSVEEESLYQAGLQTLRSGEYEAAIRQLSRFAEQFPQSTLTPNVFYWRGEAHYVLRNFELAIMDFQRVVDDFPGSEKSGDALLKRGFSEYELGDYAKAQETLARVITAFPDSSVARLARVRLDRIVQETR